MPSFTLAIFSVCAGLEHFPFFIYISHGQSKGKDSGPNMRAFAEVISSMDGQIYQNIYQTLLMGPVSSLVSHNCYIYLNEY